LSEASDADRLEALSVTKMSKETLRALQARAARAALGPSSMRNAGSKGVVESGREFLGELNLKHFGTDRRNRFSKTLDEATEGLRLAFPRSARHWGLARKGLNIFLRECLYTVYLRRAYSLYLAERFYEVPLDSLTGTKLHRAGEGIIPRWQTVRGLTPELSEAYQKVASAQARKQGMARIHLDAVWWGLRELE
jgi:hypothetical protein